jgi:hypothetical protein
LINLASAVVGGLIVLLFTNRLAAGRERQRDIEARRRECHFTASDFDAAVNKWLDLIGDKQRMTLDNMRSKSVREIDAPRLRIGLVTETGKPQARN